MKQWVEFQFGTEFTVNLLCNLGQATTPLCA